MEEERNVAVAHLILEIETEEEDACGCMPFFLLCMPIALGIVLVYLSSFHFF